MRTIPKCLLTTLLVGSMQPAMAQANKDGTTVIELFTSEGCSSCPSADKTVAAIQQQYDKHNVLVLCYHVDYWNYLGWKDVYSTHENTERQQYYANVLGLSSTYTPQAVINGKQEFVGSDKQKLREAIDHSKTNNNKLQLQAQERAGMVTVTADVIGAYCKSRALVICLVQKEATTTVTSGENGGHTLHHINLVRAYKKIPFQKQSTAIFLLPKPLTKSDIFIAGLLQDEKGTITSCAIAEVH